MQNMLGMCFNWRVLVALALIGAAVFVAAPGLGIAVLPLLILAVCPISMIVMAVTMGRMGRGGSDAGHGSMNQSANKTTLGRGDGGMVNREPRQPTVRVEGE